LLLRYREISWKEFVESHLARDNVDRLEVVNNKWVKVVSKSGVDTEVLWFSIGSVDTFERNLENAQNDLGIEAARTVAVLYKSQVEMSSVFSLLPTLLMVGFLVWSMRRAGSMMGGMGGKGGKGGGMFGGMMQSTAKIINPSEINVAFKDVAGCEEAKIEIMEFVNFLKNPGQYTELGAKIPKVRSRGVKSLSKLLTSPARAPF
jgi:AFG3 family protein